MPPSTNTGPGQSGRDNLAVFLSIFVGGGFLLFLIFVSGGLFLYVIVAVGILALLAWVHYQFWGRSMTENTAGEREDAEIQEAMREKPWWEVDQR